MTAGYLYRHVYAVIPFSQALWLPSCLQTAHITREGSVGNDRNLCDLSPFTICDHGRSTGGEVNVPRVLEVHLDQDDFPSGFLVDLQPNDLPCSLKWSWNNEHDGGGKTHSLRGGPHCFNMKPLDLEDEHPVDAALKAFW